MASDCVNGDCAPKHTQIYIYIIVCEALMCRCCRRCRLVVSVCVFWVWGVVLSTHPV